MSDINCIKCNDTGLIISKYRFEGDKKELKHYHIDSCFNCGRGSDARCHIMIHIQNKKPCDCEYRYVLDYWRNLPENEEST